MGGMKESSVLFLLPVPGLRAAHPFSSSPQQTSCPSQEEGSEQTQSRRRPVTTGHHAFLPEARPMEVGAVVLFKDWKESLLPQGKPRSNRSGQRALRGSVSRSLSSSSAWLPPSKQKQVPARLQPSPQRGAASRRELAPRLLGINLLLCPGALPRNGLPQ